MSSRSPQHRAANCGREKSSKTPMSAARSPVICDRVRAQVSLDLDGELSQLERRMLDAHLLHCPACQAYAVDVARFTTKLRAAPLEQMKRPVVLRPPRRRAILPRVNVGLAAAVAIAVFGSVLQLESWESERSSTFAQKPSRFPTLAEGRSEMQQVIADGHAFARHRGGTADVF
jgi:hypothetical protein